MYLSTNVPTFFILGGTFDPFHNGHLAIIEHILTLHSHKSNEIKILPNRIPVHKQGVTDHLHRVAMIQAGINHLGRTSIDYTDIESDRANFTIHTLSDLRVRYPEHRLIWIMGDDVLNTIHTWEDWTQLLVLCHFYVVRRTLEHTPIAVTKQLDAFKTYHSEEILTSPSGAVYIDDSRIFPSISSTDIRKKIQIGESIADLVPPSVEEYLEAHPELYQNQDIFDSSQGISPPT